MLSDSRKDKVWKVFVLFLGDDVSREVAPVAGGLDAAVDYVPGHRERVAVEVFPLVEALAVEEQLPTVGDFFVGEGVVLRSARAEPESKEPGPQEGLERASGRFEVHGRIGFMVVRGISELRHRILVCQSHFTNIRFFYVKVCENVYKT